MPDREDSWRSSAEPQPIQQRMPVETLANREIQVERKTFSLALQENANGRLLRITERAGGQRSSIVIPAPGLAEFWEVLRRFEEPSGPSGAP